jgi:hypothetical protein
MGQIMKLHLGVIDVPYKENTGITTGDVAEILEDKYHIMQTFFDMYKPQILKMLHNEALDALKDFLDGAPLPDGAFKFPDTCEEIGKLFQINFLDGEQMNDMPGVPTQAALDGYNRRLKKRTGQRRPSFVDTTQFQAAFKAWIDANN